MINFPTDTPHYLEFLVPSPVTYTLGTSVFIPFQSASRTTGRPAQSQSTFLQFFSPEGGSNVNLYEVSPYNYGLYLDTLTSTDGGNYTVEIFGECYTIIVQLKL